MSDILRSLVLGVIQGLTEFLPVSSSGHLELINYFLGSSESVDSDLTMVVLVHFGTALSILYVFRQDIINILKDLLSFRWSDETRLAMEILVSMVPAMILGLLFEDRIEEIFSGGIWMVGVSLIFTGVILWLTPNITSSEGTVGWKKALLIGVAQAVAIMPGISRSGMTIAAALMLGVGKKNAAKFSFLMVLPVIIGKLILDIASGDLQLSEGAIMPISMALISSFLVGIIACKWMIALVQKYSLKYFAGYCISIGLIVILFYNYG